MFEAFPHALLNVAACYNTKMTFIFNFVLCYRRAYDIIIITIIISIILCIAVELRYSKQESCTRPCTFLFKQLQ